MPCRACWLRDWRLWTWWCFAPQAGSAPAAADVEEGAQAATARRMTGDDAATAASEAVRWHASAAPDYAIRDLLSGLLCRVNKLRRLPAHVRGQALDDFRSTARGHCECGAACTSLRSQRVCDPVRAHTTTADAGARGAARRTRLRASPCCATPRRCPQKFHASWPRARCATPRRHTRGARAVVVVAATRTASMPQRARLRCGPAHMRRRNLPLVDNSPHAPFPACRAGPRDR